MSEHASGSHTADGTLTNIGTEITAAGVYQLVADINALGLGDTVEFEFHTKARSSDTARRYRHGAYKNPAVDPIVKSEPFEITHSGQFKIKASGVSNAFPWSIRKF